MTKTGQTLAKEIWTRKGDKALTGTDVTYSIIVKKQDEDKGCIWILTNEPDCQTGYLRQIVHALPSIGGREGLIWNFRQARKIAQGRGFERMGA